MTQTATEPIEAKFYLLTGYVQGVGFRPFVYRLAKETGVTGWIENWMGQVAIHVEGRPGYLQDFQRKLLNQAPAHSHPRISQTKPVNVEHYDSFTIHPSDATKPDAIRIIPDLPVCDTCLEELYDKNNRRHGYPFINCTECGPRYTIIEKLPYDRVNTTMAGFHLCHDCQQEYNNPLDRRFHAEPMACPSCGPSLSFSAQAGVITNTDQALSACVAALQHGEIVAVKGIGGYHFVCDASCDDAVLRLRQRNLYPHSHSLAPRL